MLCMSNKKNRESSMPVNLPNVLTLIRVILIPVLVLVAYLPIDWAWFGAAFIFWVACITDYWDGYLARKMNLMTPFGAFLDPVADKLIVAVALVVLVERDASAWLTLPAVVIVGREIVISALREWMAEMGKRASVAVSFIGKAKTLMQMVAITGLLGIQPDGQQGLIVSDLLYNISLGLLYGAAILTLWSMMIYLKAAWPDLRSNA